MSRLIAAVLSSEEIESHRDAMFDQIAASYEVFTPRQRHDFLEDETLLERLTLGERLAFRDLMTYSQARFWRLNFLTDAEAAEEAWMTVEQARHACRIFGAAKDDQALIGEAIELNLLPIHDSKAGTLIGAADFQAWHAAMEARMKAKRPETFDHAPIVFQQAV